jgi:hypothetical protein
MTHHPQPFQGVRAPSSTPCKRQAVLTGSYGHAQIHCPSRALMFFLWRATRVGQTVYRSLGCDNQRRRHLCHLRRCHHCASTCAAAIAMSLPDSGFRIKKLECNGEFARIGDVIFRKLRVRAASSCAQAKLRAQDATNRPDGQIAQKWSSPAGKNILIFRNRKSVYFKTVSTR